MRGTPLRQFCSDPRAFAFMDASADRHVLLTSAGIIRSATDGENANTTCTLENRKGEAARIFADRIPAGVACDLMDDAAVIFSGIVSAMDLDPAASVQIQA